MKFVFSLTVLAVAFFQQPQADLTGLRAALGGDAALKAVERLQVKANFTGSRRGKGEGEAFVVLPDRFIEKSRGVMRYTSPPERFPQLTAGAGGIALEEHDTQFQTGFIGDSTMSSGLRGSSGLAKEREQELRGARFAFARLLIPLFGTAPTVTAVFGRTGAIVFQDRDQTTWTLTLDAASRPATLEWEVSRLETGVTRYTSAVKTVMTFSDYRPVSGGLTWPHRMVTMQDGKTYDDVQIESYEINGKAPKVLAK